MLTEEVIRGERLGLVERLGDLDPDGWDAPSLCTGWTVRHVLAHLVTPFEVSPPQLLVHVARGRGFAGAMDRVARQLAVRPTEELLATLERNAASTFRPPGRPLAAPLTDIVVHGADIRWGLGDTHTDWGDPARLGPVLDFLVSGKARIGFAPRNVQGLHLVAEDAGWEHGEGRRVAGPALSVAVAVLGRPAALADLDGEGVAALAG